MAFIDLTFPLHPETIQSHKVQLWQKAKQKTGESVSIGLEVEHLPYRKNIKIIKDL